MADGNERLVVSLEARIRDFEKNFERAQKTANARFTAIERRAQSSAATLKAAFTGAGAAITGAFNSLGGAGIIAGGGLAGIVATLKTAATSVADLAAEAQKAGVAFEPFQELKYAAEQSRVGVDALADGLKEMQLRADEFIRTGAGSSEEAFKRLGYSAEDLKQKLQDPAALFEEIIDKLKGFSKAAQIRIADEIFGGTGGEQFVRFMEQGEGSLTRARERARELGLVISDDVGKQAQEVARQFDELGSRIEVALKTGVLEGAAALEKYKAEIIGVGVAIGAIGAGALLGPLVASLGAAAAGAVAAGVQLTRLNATILTVAAAQRAATLASAGLGAALRLLGGPAGIAITALVGAIALLATRQDQAKLAADNHRTAMVELDKAIAAVKGRVPGAEAALKSLGEQHVENAKRALADAEAELEYAKAVAANQKLGGWAAKYGATMPTTNTADMAASVEESIKRVQEAQKRLADLQAKLATAPSAAPAATYDPALPSKGPSGADVLKSAEERVRALEMERNALGMTKQAGAEYIFMQEAEAEARRQNIALTPEQMAQLGEMARKYGEVTAAIEQTKAAQEQLNQVKDLTKGFLSDFTSGLMDGKSASDAFADSLKNLLKRIVDMMLERMLLQFISMLMPGGGGMGGGMGLSGMFGFADGGVMTPQGPRKLKRYASGGVSRKAAIFGEAGPEAAVPLPDGRRIPVEMRVPDVRGSVAAPSFTNSTTLAPTYNITAGQGSQMGPMDWQKVLEGNNKSLLNSFRAQFIKDLEDMGPLAKAMTGRFGLNPARGMAMGR